ncbi:MAG: outer membrane protein [Rhizobiaceae bacterium]
MRIRSLIVGLVALFGLSAPSLAQELGDDAFVARWTGGYVGVVAGYHAGDIVFSDCTGLCPTNPKMNTGGIGIQAGYDHQFANNLVLGGYVNIPIAANKGSFNIGFPGFDFTVRSRFAAHIGARLGYDINGFMPYVAGGYSVADIEASAFFAAQRTNTHHGYHLAVGLEYLWSEHFSTDVRYTYSELGKRTYDFGGGASRWGERASNITFAASYRF